MTASEASETFTAEISTLFLQAGITTEATSSKTTISSETSSNTILEIKMLTSSRGFAAPTTKVSTLDGTSNSKIITSEGISKGASFQSICNLLNFIYIFKGVARGEGKGGNSPPPETEKIVVEKWCYFRKLYF